MGDPERQSCGVTVWLDGAYSTRCARTLVAGECGRHGVVGHERDTTHIDGVTPGTSAWGAC